MKSRELLNDLVAALEGSFISSWQSTAGWQKQLDAAREYLDQEKRRFGSSTNRNRMPGEITLKVTDYARALGLSDIMRKGTCVEILGDEYYFESYETMFPASSIYGQPVCGFKLLEALK